MDKIKVMHVLNTGGYSGAENVVITIINNLRNSVDAFYVSPKGTIDAFLERESINHFTVNGDKLTVKELNRAVKNIKPDIIHAHDFTAGVVSTMASFGIPIINHIHNNSLWIRYISLKSIVYLISTLRYKRILTVSDSIMDEYVFGALCRKKTLTIGNPINIESIKAKADSASINDKSDLIFLGRLSDPKNPLMYVEIVRELVKSMPDIRTIIVGDGELRGEVESAIKYNKLEKNIKLYGFQENPYGLLKNSRVLCMPSKWEGFGLAAIEAMSLGIPVAAANVGGLRIIVDYGCGSLNETVSEFSEVILKLLNNKEYYKEISHSAYKKALTFDNYASYTDLLKKIYLSLSGVKEC